MEVQVLVIFGFTSNRNQSRQSSVVTTPATGHNSATTLGRFGWSSSFIVLILWVGAASAEVGVHLLGGSSISVVPGEPIDIELSLLAPTELTYASVKVRHHPDYQTVINQDEIDTKETIRVVVPTVATRERFLRPGRYDLLFIYSEAGHDPQTKPIATIQVTSFPSRSESDLQMLIDAQQQHLIHAPLFGRFPEEQQDLTPSDLAKSSLPSFTTLPPPPPFSPLRTTGQEIQSASHRIVVGNDGLPSHISSLGLGITAGPLTLVFGDEARSHDISTGLLEMKQVSDRRVTWRTELQSSSHEVTVLGEASFDGLVRYTFRVETSEGAQDQTLSLCIPFKPSVAKFYNHLTLGTRPLTKANPELMFEKEFGGGLLTTQKTLPFSFQYQFLNFEVGLAIIVESLRDLRLRVADIENAFTVSTSSDATTVCLLVASNLRATNGEPSTQEINLAIQPMPVRPFPSSKDIQLLNPAQWANAKALFGFDYLAPGSIPNNARNYLNLSPLDAPKSAVEQAKADGLRVFVLHQGWTEVQGYPGTFSSSRKRKLQEFISVAHQNDIKVVLYLGLELAENAPEWGALAARISRLPLRFGRSRGATSSLRPSGGNSEYSEFLVRGVRRLVEEYDIDGVFLDLIPETQISMNPIANEGYRDDNGALHGDLKLLEARSMLSKIYEIFHPRTGPQGIVIGHVNGPFRPGHAFLDYVLTGEAEAYRKIRQAHLSPDEILDLDEFAAIYNPRVWGIPLVWMSKPSRGGLSMNQSAAVSLLFGIPQRTQWPHFIPDGVKSVMLNPIQDVIEHWRIWQTFPVLGDVTRYPFWRNSHLLDTHGRNIRISIWKTPKNELHVILSNLGKNKKNVPLTLHLTDLGLPSDGFTVHEPTTGEELGNQFPVPLSIRPHDFKYIVLRYEKRASQ